MGDELHPGASISDGAKNTTDPDTGRTPTGAPLAELGDAQGGALRGMRPANPPVYTVAEPPERLATAGALPHPSSPVYPSHAATPAGAAAYQPAVPAHGPPSHLTPEQPVAGVNYPAFSASHAVPHWVPGSSATPGTQPSPATYGTLYGAAAPLHAGVTMPFAPSADFATPVELGSALGSQQPALLQLARAGYQGFSFPVAGPRQTPAPVPSRPSAAAVTGPSQGRPVSAATQEPGRRVAQVRAHTGPAPRMVGRPPAEHADGGRGRGRRRPQERNPYGKEAFLSIDAIDAMLHQAPKRSKAGGASRAPSKPAKDVQSGGGAQRISGNSGGGWGAAGGGKASGASSSMTTAPVDTKIMLANCASALRELQDEEALSGVIEELRVTDFSDLIARQSTEDSPYDPSTGSRPAIMDAIGMQTADQISEWIMDDDRWRRHRWSSSARTVNASQFELFRNLVLWHAGRRDRMDWVIRGEELVGRQGMQQLMNITRMVARRVVRIRHALERVQERAQAVAEAPPLGLPRRISQLMDLQGGSSGSR